MKSTILNTGEWLSKPRIVIGIMSGTSLDGVDIAIARFDNNNGKHTFTQLHEYTQEFSRPAFVQFKRLIEEPVTIAEVCDASVYLMQLYQAAIETACQQANISIQEIDAIGIHGQTVWHSPKLHEYIDTQLRSTLQLASGSSLANTLGCTVVSDFRTADVALGGEGAPLVPIFDYHFLKDDSQQTVALNIGGIANVTLLPANASLDSLFAFDTGPGNVWIDATMMYYYGKRYDTNGNTAKAGVLIPQMLEELQALPFIHQSPPKSTGRELFSHENLHFLLNKYMRIARPPEDAVATLTEFTAWSIAHNINTFAPDTQRVIVSGGGARNTFLLDKLSHYSPTTQILTSNDIGISIDAKEALCFAYLAYRTLAGLHSNIPSVTSASKTAVLGSISIP